MPGSPIPGVLFLNLSNWGVEIGNIGLWDTSKVTDLCA